MKRILLLLMAMLSIIGVHAKDKYEIPQYEIEAAGSGVQGTYLVRVWVLSKSGKVADSDIKKAAVHGVIFRGFSGGAGSPSQRPMASIADEAQKAEYFHAFFDERSGIYSAFANIVEGSYQRVKASKHYKVGAVVQVSKDELRRELERSGVVRGLNSGF